MIPIAQKTINNKISCNGIALHSGANTSIELLPAPCNSGIIFNRTDVENGKGRIAASYKNVSKTTLGTTISNEFGIEVSTIEHLMAAIWGAKIDNLIINITGPEIPIMDGSSEPFLFLIECAGSKEQEESRNFLEILKPIRVEDDDKFVEVKPAKGFYIDLEVDFNHGKISKQSLSFDPNNTSFKNDICRARTFGFQHEIDQLHQMGLAQGGSLDNAILINEDGIVNQEGWRYENELVRHKTLDFIGDIFLSQHYILGHFTAFKSGHKINNALLHKLFEDKSAWKIS